MKSHALHILALLVIGVLVYGQVVGFEFVQYDDPAYVSENGIVTQGVTAKGVIWAFTMQGETHLLMHQGVANLWHPLTWISHMVDCSLFGHESAMGHHLVNLILHLLSGVLAYMVARALGFAGWAGVAGAVLFLIHPMKSESVAWVSERKDVLSGFFFLLTVYLSLVKEGKLKWWAFLAFILALLSKPSVVVLPLLMVLLTLWRRGDDLLSLPSWVKEGIKWWPWFIMSAAVAVLTVVMQSGGSHKAFMESFPLMYRLTTMASGLCYYLYHLVIPHNLNFHYAPPTVPYYVHYLTWGAVILLSGLIIRWRTRFPALLPCALWFLICWLPVSGLLYVGTSFTCDRYVYLSSILPALCLARWACSKRWSAVLFSVILIAFGGLCFKQVGIWKNSRSLFEHAASAQPNDPLGWTNLGALNAIDGRREEAITCYENALELNATEYFALHNLGDLYRKQERFPEAIEQFQKVNKYAPSYLPSWRAKGYVYREMKEYEASINAFMGGFEASGQTSPIELWLAIETMMVAGDNERAARALEYLRPMKLSPILVEYLGKADAYLQRVKEKNEE